MSLPKTPLVLSNTLLRIALVALCSFFLWRAIGVFGPGSDVNITGFNSDSAIPVLMSNDHRPLTIFNFYYYGADRWGGWPFLVTRLISNIASYHWTAESVFVFHVIWIFVGALTFAALSRRDCFVALVSYLIALCLHRESRYLIFALSQLYAWQATATLLSWLSLRRFFDQHVEPAGNYVWWRCFWLLLVLVFSFLAIWSSAASTLFLGFLLSLDTLRAWLKASPTQLARRVIVPCGQGFAAIAVATLIERVLKAEYRRFSLAHYGDDYATRFGLDFGHFAENFREMVRVVSKLSWWPIYVVPAPAITALVIAVLFAWAKDNDRIRATVRATVAEDTLILALGAYGIAVLNFALAVAVSHVRENFYDIRYLTLTNLFAPISGVLTAFVLLKIALHSSRMSRYVQPGFLAVTLAILAIKFPVARHSLTYQRTKTAALVLVRKAPGALLMGTYWNTYVFTALQRDDAMVPVPVEGEVTRTPWTRDQVRHARQVILAFTRGHGGAPSPPEILRQHGGTFRLVDPHWYENEEYLFAEYARDTR